LRNNGLFARIPFDARAGLNELCKIRFEYLSRQWSGELYACIAIAAIERRDDREIQPCLNFADG